MSETTDPTIAPFVASLSLAVAALAAATSEHEEATARVGELLADIGAAEGAYDADPTQANGRTVLAAEDAHRLAGLRLDRARARLETATAGEQRARDALDLAQRKIQLDRAHAAARVPVLVEALAPVVKLRREIAGLEARARELHRDAVDTFAAAVKVGGVRLPFAVSALAAEILIEGRDGPAVNWHERLERLGIGPGVVPMAIDEWWARLMAGETAEALAAEGRERGIAAGAEALAHDVARQTDPIGKARAAAAELRYRREHDLLADRAHDLLAIIAAAFHVARAATGRSGPGVYVVKRGAAEERIGIEQHEQRDDLRIARLLGIDPAELPAIERLTPSPPDAAPRAAVDIIAPPVPADVAAA